MNPLRSYIAGLGSGGALIAAVVVALVSLGGVVAVEGLPGSSKSASAQNVLVKNEMAALDDDAIRATAPPSRVPSLIPPPGAPHTFPPANPPHHNPPNHQPTPPPAVPTPIPTHQGPVGGLVVVVNETVHGATGVDPHLPGAIAPVTNPIDEVIAGLTGGNLPPPPKG